jgi:hypothetical protein
MANQTARSNRCVPVNGAQRDTGRSLAAMRPDPNA